MYRVLLVDADALMRQALETVISGEAKFSVAGSVATGEEAVTLCRKERIDLIFMDVLLPGMTGIEAGIRISRDNPSVDIIVISALDGFDIMRKALSTRIRDYLVKPVSAAEVRRLLQGYHSAQKDDTETMLRLMTVLKERRYTGLQEAVPEAVADVFGKTAGSREQVLGTFMQIAKRILSQTSPEGNVNIAERFHINEVFATEELSWVFWLTDVADYAFRLPMVMKYDYVSEVFHYIDREIKNNISPADICDACNISQGYLGKLFRRYFGVSVLDYIHLRKLMQAKMYIAFSDMTLTEIGHYLGYSDGGYFSKVFKKYMGIPAKQYQMSLGKAGRSE